MSEMSVTALAAELDETSPPPPPPPPQHQHHQQQHHHHHQATPVSRSVIRNTDMPAEMQRDALEYVSWAFALHDNAKDVAMYVTKKFDEKYGSAWHAIVGRNFRCYVEHDQGTFIYFYTGQMAVVLFKSGKLTD